MKNQIEKRLYHYTVKANLKKILESGFIRVERSRKELIEEYKRKGKQNNVSQLEKAKDWVCVAWFSTDPQWERTANKSLSGGIGLQANVEFVPCRLCITDAVSVGNWTSFRKQYNKDANLLSKANMGSNPYTWYYTCEPVPIDSEHIASIGVYENGEWHDYTLEEFLKMPF